MKVSFLVTYYNQKEYVKQSLDSILAIDKPCDWEILIGDDGSSDGTIEEVNKYVKKHPDNIKLYVMPRENGKKYDSVRRASANRLNILEHSTGDIFCTLDGDDYFCDTEFIKDAVEIFNKNQNISIVAFGFKYVTDETFGKQMLLPEKVKNMQVDKKTYIEHFYLHAGGCVHRKQFGKERMKYIKELGYYDDNNIVINSLNYGEMFAVNRAIYAYRQTGNSIYTSMEAIEQAVLNVQGMDVDLKLVDENLKDSILKRYSEATTLMFIWRKKLREILGEEKYNKYMEGSRSIIPSYCYDLLNYESLSNNKNCDIKGIMKLCRKYTLKQYIKYYLKGICK